MVKIKDYSDDISVLANEYPENSVQRKVLDTMISSTNTYEFESVDELKFELQLRKEIVDSSIALNRSGMDFKVFKESRCNPEFWERTESGGFKLKEDVKPSDGMNDIFTNGREYGTECATAMTIVYYKSLLNVFGEELFNNTFKTIYLMDWDVRDPLLREVRMMQPIKDVLLGDRQYFSNPDVNPETPEWQGENVIVLDKDKYYGHGIGITNGERIIKALNSNRKEDATQSAYLMGTAGRPNFKKLYNAYMSRELAPSTIVWAAFPTTMIQRV
jgi:protein-glutamine gamma-glutamyltransferase